MGECEKGCQKAWATVKITRPSTLENRCKLYPSERILTKANQPSLNLEGGTQGEI